MSAQKRGREVSSATRGALAYARFKNRSPLRVIQARTGVPISTISDITNHAYKRAKIHETASFHGENTAPGSRSGRSSMLCQEEIDNMIKLATSSYEWRRKSWMDVAHECNVKGSKPTISKAFHEAGYERYSPRHKPWLTDTMKFVRLQWCKDRVHWDLTTQGWDRVIYTDETSVILGEHRGQKHVTRKKNEEWDSMCCDKDFSQYSTFMFWGSIALNWKGPCYIYRPEDKKERAAFITALTAADVLRRPLNRAAHAIRRAELLRQQKNHERVLTHASTFSFASCERSARGGIDWYRYNRCILQPLLLPAYQKFKASHANRALLMQDGASNHISQWNRSLFMEQEIDLLFWSGNSPDLNPIEHIWNLIKDRVSRRRFFIKGRLELKLAWYDEWDKLNIEKNINPFILNQKHRVNQIILKQGDNHFHG